MASLRRATCAVTTTLKPRPQLLSVRWASDLPRGRGPRRGGRRGGRGRFFGLAAAAFVTGAALYSYSTFVGPEKKGKASTSSSSSRDAATVIIPKAEIEFEETLQSQQARDGQDDVRATISPQHRQVQDSLENPGVYAWGSNAGRVVAPDLPDAAVIKEPRRMPFFDGQVLRDLCLDRDVGVAVTEAGDVLQWGVGLWGRTTSAAARPTTTTPLPTLTGKDIVKVAVSRDRILALSSNGSVYSLPVAQADQQQQQQQQTTTTTTTTTTSSSPSSSSSSSWWRNVLWRTPAPSAGANVRTVTPNDLAWNERVVDVRAGLEHCLLLTSKGRVFSAVASFDAFPARGQLGLPGLTFATRPPGPVDAPHEVTGLRGIAATQIAAGDHHSLVLAKDGSLYAFGDNAAGQLCLPASPNFPSSEAPIQVPVAKLYESNSGSGSVDKALVLTGTTPSRAVRPPRVTSIAAGGATSFFTVDAEEETGGAQTRVVADTWSCGSGLAGNLGTGKWVHVSTKGPGKIPALSGLREYDEAAGRTVPLHVAHLAAGTTHASAVLDNATRVTARPSSSSSSSADTNWGADVLWWGGNEHYQLGTGKRNNLSEPVHIAPLDGREQLALPGAERTPELLDQQRARLSLTPRTTVRLDSGRTVRMEQRVVCGRYVSGVYSGV
ncbi:mitochondrial protein [Niveomyces insectorum RCEF 264]|uniref:Mitochondrial protein n=1 Tax=Niveomyces insectorum RCEF 264 TaxID=1081102 RepID=A0A167X9Q0_9HYPO|nr:mitochondrial protein [Niveomyces insectorum RCEF 264]